MRLNVAAMGYLRFLGVRKANALRERLTGARGRPRRIGATPVLGLADASRLIRAGLGRSEPFFAGRIGTSELQAVYEAIEIELGLRSRYSERTARVLCVNAGFFPREDKEIERFARMMIDMAPEADFLGLLGYPQFLIQHARLPAAIGDLRALEPHYEGVDWSAALAGRRVLVIHPLAELIEHQYARRTELFADQAVLPEFELQTIKAVQSQANEPTRFASWFEALDAMSAEMAACDFDTVLIGAGAYGFPLGCLAKRMGRDAIHIGGALQILFGIKGRRWDNHPVISHLYNDHWVRPPQSAVPRDSRLVEDGCYW